MDLRFNFKINDKDAVAASEKNEFSKWAGAFGLEAADYGTEIRFNGSDAKLVGFLPNRPKYGYRLRNMKTGRDFLATDAVVDRVKAARPKKVEGTAA